MVPKQTKSMATPQFYIALASKTGVEKKDIKKVIGGLRELVVSELKTHGQVKIPGMAVFRLRTKAARPAMTRTVFGKQMEVPARKQSQKMTAAALKALRDELC